MDLGGINYLFAVAGTFAATAVTTPIFRAYAVRRDVVDGPDGGRKTQSIAVPYLGGLAIAWPMATLLVLAGIFGRPSGLDLGLLLGVLLPALVLSIIGLVDDLRGLSARSRFVAQSLAGAVTGVAMSLTGTRGALFGNLWLDTILVVVWVIAVSNAINLMDNMDGLAAGVSAIAASGYFVIASMNGQYLVAALALALAGACGGFLVWNRHPASIYMGDSGSLFIGLLLAAISIRIDLKALPQIESLFVPLLVLALPILDTALVVISRLRRGISPFQGGRDHLSHRIQRAGFSVPATVAVLYILGITFAALAWVAAHAAWKLGAIALAALAFVTILVWGLRQPDSA